LKTPSLARAQQFIRLQAVSQTGKNVLRMPG
jgi:hypothetical protein